MIKIDKYFYINLEILTKKSNSVSPLGFTIIMLRLELF